MKDMTTVHIYMVPLNTVELVIEIFLGRGGFSGLKEEKYSILLGK